MDRVPPDTALEHAQAVRAAQTDELKARTGDKLYPPLSEEPAEPAAGRMPAAGTAVKDPRDTLVPDPGDVKAATANPKFGEDAGATPPEPPSTHATPSTGDVHAPTGNKALE